MQLSLEIPNEYISEAIIDVIYGSESNVKRAVRETGASNPVERVNKALTGLEVLKWYGVPNDQLKNQVVEEVLNRMQVRDPFLKSLIIAHFDNLEFGYDFAKGFLRNDPAFLDMKARMIDYAESLDGTRLLNVKSRSPKKKSSRGTRHR